MGPVSRLSRDLFCLAVPDADGNLFLTEREPFRYVQRDDTTEYIAKAGDTWDSLADDFYGDALGDAAGADLWYVIPDFQPEPVVDPTLTITPGTVLYIPSLQTVLTEVLAESRRRDFQA